MHTSSIRMPDDIYARSQRVARRRRISLNQLIQQALQREIQEELDREMVEAAALLAESPEDADVEYAFDAQAEVAQRHAE